MILTIECLVVSLVFGIGMVIATLCNKTAWFSEYAPEVQKVFLEKHPEYKNNKPMKIPFVLLIGKVIFCLCCVFILTILVRVAGATTFKSGILYSFTIWFVADLFDLFVLDWGVFMYWKKIRLPGTEEMDYEYKMNKFHHVKEGLFGVIIGIPVCILVGVFSILVH